MIYLFTNEKYGRPFNRAAIEYARRNRRRICLVFSTRMYPLLLEFPRHKILTKFLTLGQTIWLAARYRAPVRLADDVNRPGFIRETDGIHGIIVGFNQIFKPGCIEKFKSLVNIHPTVLPLYRGPVPSYWCLKNKEKRTGYTLHKVTPKIDSGEILFQESFEVGDADTPERLNERIALKAMGTFIRYLDHLHDRSEWTIMRLNAYEVYENHPGYLGFPKSQRS